MAIVVLVLWLFTAGAGLYLLVTGSLGRSRPAPEPAASVAAPAQAAASPARSPPAAPRRETRAARDRFAPPSLTASRNAPVVPGLRSLLEFAHPACALVGFGFWMGYTFVHYRALGWIGFGLLAVTAALGLSWLAANARAARPGPGDERRPAHERPSFNGRLAVLHGGAAAVTVVLAALAVLVLRA